MQFNAEKLDGGWLVFMDDSTNNGAQKVIVKDNELVKQFKEFVESSKITPLNEG